MINDIHQSKKYGQYMKKIGWIVEKVNDCQIFIRRFPLIGSLIKIQRLNQPIPLKEIEKVARKYHAFKIIIEPQAKSLLRWWSRKAGTARTVGRSDKHEKLTSEISLTMKQLKSFGYKKSNSPYLPTKTVQIDLTLPEKEILSQMKKKTRYSLRRAQKSSLIIKKSEDIESFIQLKAKYFFPFGFFVKKEINALWQIFHPKHAILLLASDTNNDSLAGIFLLFHQKTAHYWLAASTKQGKKLSAPTLLVWKALKLSKKRGCKIFDFQGIYDSRFHKTTKFWQGFTRFKKGFGGKEIEYPGCFVKYRIPV